MKLVIVTTADDHLGGVFAQAYRLNGGPPPDVIIVLDNRDELSYPAWARGFVALKLFGIWGTLRIIASCYMRAPLCKRDKSLGLHRDWLSALSSVGTQLIRCHSINDSDTVVKLKKIQPDLLISIGAPAIFKKPVLEVPKIAAINIHNGRLPKYRGHFGTFWEVLNGEPWVYTCIHEMAEEVDAGRLVAVDRVKVDGIPSFLDLLMEKKRRGGILLSQIIQEIRRLKGLPGLAPKIDLRDTTSGYYGWPTLSAVRSFSWKKSLKKIDSD